MGVAAWKKSRLNHLFLAALLWGDSLVVILYRVFAKILKLFDPTTPCTIGKNKEGAPTNKCTPKNRNAFNISSKDGVPPDDGIVFGIGSKEVDLEFYAGAHSNQMPIKKLSVAWGDGADPTKAGVFLISK